MTLNRINPARVFLLLIIMLFVVSLSGCSYSFSGSSVPSHLKTIYIPAVKDNSGRGETFLSQTFSEIIVQKFIDDNSFTIGKAGKSDALLELVVLSVTDDATVIRNEKASDIKVNLTVKVTYKDLIKKETVLSRNFSEFGVYKAGSVNLIEDRKTAIKEALEKLTDSIVLSVVSNW